MITKQFIEQEIASLDNMKELVGVYEEIAATRMRKIRNLVLKNRDYLGGLAGIFEEVKRSYTHELEILMKHNKKKDFSKVSLKNTNGKTVYVLLSANAGLYGDIVNNTFRTFVDEVRKGDPDITIIGKVGKNLFEHERLKNDYEYFDFPDESIDVDTIKSLIHHLLQYEKVMIFHGKFISVVSQKPTVTSITGDVTVENPSRETAEYLFEPSLESVVTFFETEIFASLLEQTIHESHLAKFASRMISLNSATDTIDSRIKQTQFDKQKLKHQVENQKQVNLLSGMSLWKQ